MGTDSEENRRASDTPEPGEWQLKLRIGKPTSPAIFANYAMVSQLGNLDTFYIEFGLAPSVTALRSADKEAVVEVPVVASIVCSGRLIPALIVALQKQLDISKKEQHDVR